MKGPGGKAFASVSCAVRRGHQAVRTDAETMTTPVNRSGKETAAKHGERKNIADWHKNKVRCVFSDKAFDLQQQQNAQRENNGQQRPIAPTKTVGNGGQKREGKHMRDDRAREAAEIDGLDGAAP